MNRDAKIGVVVILLIVVVLVIIWGRQEPPDGELEATGRRATGAPDTQPQNYIDTGTSPAGEAVRAQSPEGAEVVPEGLLPSPEELEMADAPVEAPTIAPPEEPPVTPQPTTWTYTVVDADVLESIAREQLDDPTRWPEIAKLNNLAEPYLIRPGQKLVMPAKEGGAPAAAAPPTAPSGVRRYVVTEEDIGLIQIAQDQLGDRTLWRKVAELNGLTEPYVIRRGQVLLLPE